MNRITFLTTLIIAAGCTEQSPLQPPRSISASVDHGIRAATLVVDDDGLATATDCNASGAAFSSIQAAVEAAGSGDRILVCAGTYDEQVVVTKNGLTIASTDAGLAVLRPTVVTPNTTGLFTGAPLAPIVLVDGATGVTLTGFTVDGGFASLSTCLPVYLGVYYRNASGTIAATHVTNIIHSAVTFCGFAIAVESGNGVSSLVTVRGSVVDNYGGAGILCNQTGTDCSVVDNVFRGRGPVADFPMIGIQIGFGAGASEISGNTVTDHVWVGGATRVNPAVLQPFGVGILLGWPQHSTEPVVKMQANEFANNDVNIWRIGSPEALRAFLKFF